MKSCPVLSQDSDTDSVLSPHSSSSQSPGPGKVLSPMKLYFTRREAENEPQTPHNSHDTQQNNHQILSQRHSIAVLYMLHSRRPIPAQPTAPHAPSPLPTILGGAGVASHLTSLWPVCFSSSAAIVSASSGLVAKSSKPISLHRARVSWLRTAHGCGWVRVGGVRVWVRVGVRVGLGLGLGLELGLGLGWGVGVRASSS